MTCWKESGKSLLNVSTTRASPSEAWPASVQSAAGVGSLAGAGPAAGSPKASLTLPTLPSVLSVYMPMELEDHRKTLCILNPSTAVQQTARAYLVGLGSHFCCGQRRSFSGLAAPGAMMFGSQGPLWVILSGWRVQVRPSGLHQIQLPCAGRNGFQLPSPMTLTHPPSAPMCTKIV